MKIRSIIFHLLEWLGFTEKRYRIQRVPELPDNPRPFVIYAIGDPDAWLAALICPCGCGHLIQLSLLQADSPHWSLQSDRDGEVSISPSGWRSLGCEAHFFVRGGRIIWCSRES
jgi:hypothetical protein